MKSGLPSRIALTVAAFLLLGMTTATRATEKVTLEAKLIWATNHDQAPEKDYKHADEQLSKDLQRAFKWKNYFIIKSKKAAVEKDKKEEIVLSDQCRLAIKYLGDDMFEVWIWGKDPKTGKEKAVLKGKQKMESKQKVLLMGVSDDESGWVVKICRRDED